MKTVTASHGRWDIWVIVPANNEEHLVGSTLSSIAAALTQAHLRLARSTTVVVADRCTDHTIRYARRVRVPGKMFVVPAIAGNVGTARMLGVQVAQSVARPLHPSRTWIASTDADTLVPVDWITQQLDAADQGVMGIAGVVDIDKFEDSSPCAHQYFDESYTRKLPRTGDHPHVHAANMGFRLDAYRSAGGWAPLARSEDRDLWERLRRTGATLHAPTHLRVTTSGRSTGRVVGGFADSLAEQVADYHASRSLADGRQWAPMTANERQ
jgi:glycosyltransferase involved in cell wall biosynthesis